MTEQKTALITGGNKGIGLVLTNKFIEAGHDVIVVARNFDDFTLADHQQVRVAPFDLSNIDGIPQLIADLPPVDILINNAGVLFSLPYDNYPSEKQEQMLKINLEAPVAMIREVAKSMVEKGYGRIVNNSSIAGHIGHPDLWYGITKAGVINMTKSYAKILGGNGIVINAVASGPVETEMLYTIPEARRKAIKEAVYTGRFAKPEEVADTMFWLATDCPEYINGTCIDINNGAFPR